MPPTSSSQFDLRTIFAYTFVIALGLGYCSATDAWDGGFWLALPLLAWPPLFVRSIDRHLPLKMSGANIFAQTFLVCLFSSAALVLSTIAFVPDWKGSKGMNWIFYINDGAAALVYYPFYFGGAIAFYQALLRPASAVMSPLTLTAVATSAFISFLYVFYVVVMRYTGNGGNRLVFVIAPGSAAIAYTCMFLALFRRFEKPREASVWNKTYLWVASFLVACIAKVPLAMVIYRDLSDTRPDDCFIVTAATRGHRSVVRTSYDATLDREVNDQLRHFWEFESWLNERSPRFHRALRRVYNRIGPRISAVIVTRWQADLIYLLLKPLEWIARGIVHATKHRLRRLR